MCNVKKTCWFFKVFFERKEKRETTAAETDVKCRKKEISLFDRGGGGGGGQSFARKSSCQPADRRLSAQRHLALTRLL